MQLENELLLCNLLKSIWALVLIYMDRKDAGIESKHDIVEYTHIIWTTFYRNKLKAVTV